MLVEQLGQPGAQVIGAHEHLADQEGVYPMPAHHGNIGRAMDAALGDDDAISENRVVIITEDIAISTDRLTLPIPGMFQDGPHIGEARPPTQFIHGPRTIGHETRRIPFAACAVHHRNIPTGNGAGRVDYFLHRETFAISQIVRSGIATGHEPFGGQQVGLA